MEVKNKLKRLLINIYAIFLATQGSAFAATMPEMTVPNQYPAKYTPEYIRQITPTYRDIGKDEVF